MFFVIVFVCFLNQYPVFVALMQEALLHPKNSLLYLRIIVSRLLELKKYIYFFLKLSVPRT